MPFQAATLVEIPRTHNNMLNHRQPRGLSLKANNMAKAIPNAMSAAPRARAKMIRGRLPLQMASRMKFG